MLLVVEILFNYLSARFLQHFHKITKHVRSTGGSLASIHAHIYTCTSDIQFQEIFNFWRSLYM